MKKYLFVSALALLLQAGNAQSNVDSLLRIAAVAPADSTRVFTLARIAVALMYSAADSSLRYAKEALATAQEIQFKKGEAQALSIIANIYSVKSDYTRCFEYNIQALRIYEELNLLSGVANTYNNISLIYEDQGDYVKALQNYHQAKAVFEQLQKTDNATFEQKGFSSNVVIILSNIGNIYEKINKPDSALYFLNEAYGLAQQINDHTITGTILTNLGNVHEKLAHTSAALSYFRASLPFSVEAEDMQTLAEANLGIARILRGTQQVDSALHYAHAAYAFAVEASHLKGQEQAALFLSQQYEKQSKPDSALAYYKIFSSIGDSISSTEIVRQLNLMNFNEQLLQQKRIAAEQQYKSNIKMYALSGGILSLVVVALVLYRSNRQKQKANQLLQAQKAETEVQREKAETALEDLKKTQKQLIQREKMASLGELTAGIAHEIQNPLNFVNNFSELNVELLSDLEKEVYGNNKMEAMVIAQDLKKNLQKITLHGKRADAIVKGMLEHSRTSTGKKEATDINALVSEQWQLAYHGIRARDKTFKAVMEMHFDKDISPLPIVPQDIGRVLLNVYSNAFYAVAEKKKAAGPAYEPLISINTQQTKEGAIIVIKDNGIGIPHERIDKIFQPFFTTKSTGTGTGLGLSLSYDIIKAHGGEIKVESKEGEGAAFSIYLPA